MLYYISVIRSSKKLQIGPLGFIKLFHLLWHKVHRKLFWFIFYFFSVLFFEMMWKAKSTVTLEVKQAFQRIYALTIIQDVIVWAVELSKPFVRQISFSLSLTDVIFYCLFSPLRDDLRWLFDGAQQIPLIELNLHQTRTFLPRMNISALYLQ